MSDPVVEILRAEPKKELRPFFAARTLQRAAARRGDWLGAYWTAATAASALILVWTGWAMEALVPAGYWIARSGWRPWLNGRR